MRVFPCARSLGETLCEEVLAAAAALREHPERLVRPLWVVVPSGSLRSHYAQRLVAAATGSLLGVQITTLEGLAQGLAAGAERLTPGSKGLFRLAVERVARGELALEGSLGAMAGGHAAVAACVDDLLDAGFLPALEDALGDCVADVGGGPRTERAAALVRVASELWHEAEAGRFSHRSRLFTCAREAVEDSPAAALRVSGLWVVGFADATGVQADFLETLVRVCGARVLLERPADPAGAEDPGALFGARLRERLESAAGLEDCREVSPPPATRIEVLEAPDREAEVRGIALRLRARLDAGEAPESIAVVARDLEPFALSLRRWLGRLGVPHSGHDQRAAAGPAARRVLALRSLLEAGRSPGIEVWLDALGEMPTPREGVAASLSFAERADLRRALHRRGCVRLGDLAELEVHDSHAPEPSQHGEHRRDESGKEWLARARLAAASAVALLQAAPDRASLARQLSWLREFLEQALGWGPETPGAALVEGFFQDAAFAGAESLDISREEFRALLLGGLDGAGRDALGGAGGGVQVLSVMEARGLCFESIYLLGVNRGSFPRSISEDPLLPDALRVALRAVLPDLPVKREGHDEERFLFAQLLGQAPEVFLSWAASSEEAAQLLPSALLEGARAAGLVQSSEALPPLHAAPESLGLVPRPAAEHALLAGVHRGFAAQGPALAVALAEEAGGVCADASAQAAARLAVSAEYDRYWEEGAELGPYFGFVGARAEPAADVSDAPSVTFVEQMARCPWSAFLQRVLGVRPPRDAMAALPSRGSDSWLLGNVVHRALEVLIGEALPGTSADLEGAGTPVPRPALPRVEQALLAAAQHELRDAAIPIPGYARVMARAGLPMVAEAFEVDWSENGPPHVLGVEVAARVEILDAAGTPRALRFRADRVDRVVGGLRLSDYKTGRSKVGGKQEEKRRKKFLDFIANGALLQAAVYANLGPGAEGRYLYLDAKKRGDIPFLALTADAEVQAALGAALAAVLDARDEGAYVPRLLDKKGDNEPRNCERCEVKQACLRGDSSATGRIRRFLTEGDSTSRGAPQHAAVRLLLLQEPRP